MWKKKLQDPGGANLIQIKMYFFYCDLYLKGQLKLDYFNIKKVFIISS